MSEFEDIGEIEDKYSKWIIKDEYLVIKDIFNDINGLFEINIGVLNKEIKELLDNISKQQRSPNEEEEDQLAEFLSKREWYCDLAGSLLKNIHKEQGS